MNSHWMNSYAPPMILGNTISNADNQRQAIQHSCQDNECYASATNIRCRPLVLWTKWNIAHLRGLESLLHSYLHVALALFACSSFLPHLEERPKKGLWPELCFDGLQHLCRP